MAARKLTAKQERFAQLYVEAYVARKPGKTVDASACYRAAYSAEKMKPETVNKRASELLQHGAIAGRIEELKERAMKRHDVTVERVLAEVAKLAFADLGDFVNVSKDGHVSIDFRAAAEAGQLGALAEVTQDAVGEDVVRTKFKLYSKTDALKMLGSHLAMWVERKQHETDPERPVEVATKLPTLSPKLAQDVGKALRRALQGQEE